MAKLGEVCKVSPSTKNIERQGAWLLNLDMVEQQTGRVIEYKYVGEDDLNGSIIQFDTENVLYSKLRPNLNKVVLPPKDGFSTSELLPLRPDASVLNKDYLAAFLRSDSFVTWAVSKTAGAKMPRLGTKDLMNAEIPVPSIEQQKKIAEKFKKLEQLISLRKQQLAKLDELVKARFVEMFGDHKSDLYNWTHSTIGECCILKSGTSLPADRENEGGNIPYIKVGDMNIARNRQYITTSSRFVTEQTAGNGIFPVGTVIFPKRGGAIGTNKKRLTVRPICADLNIMGVTAGKQLVPQYLMAYFSMIDLGKLNNGSSVPQINNKDIAPLPINLPPIKLQNQFSDFVERVDQQKQTVQQSLEKLELMKKALMQEYFG